jgi:hypothetical protein
MVDKVEGRADSTARKYDSAHRTSRAPRRERISNAAAQTRIVPKARIRLDCKSVRSFKAIVCVDISEFESCMRSHAVGLSQVRGKHFPAPTAPAAWVAGPAAQKRICSNGKKLSGSCQYIFQARLAVARVVWLCFVRSDSYHKILSKRISAHKQRQDTDDKG